MNYNTPLPPFKWFILENFPYIEDDFDALTNWQLFCKLGKEMNKIIEKTNLTGEQVEILTNSFNALQNYVNNYFENLDVQEEVNTKLDEMAESGQLTDIIAQYLQLAGVLAYDTKTAMKNATNLVEGSIAKTLGNTSYSDGQGAFYKVRQVQNTDVIDDNNIIALNDPDLVAQKIQYSSGYDLQNQITTNANNITANSNKITTLQNNEKTISNLVIISDSYGVGNSYPTDPITSYAEYMKTYLGLTNDTFYNNSWGGSGFAHVSYDKKFLTLVNECNTNLSQDRRNSVTHVLLAGGYNDQFNTETEVKNGIIETTNRAHEVFPNAQIYVAFIGWRTNGNNLFDVARYYIEASGICKYAKFIVNSNNILRGDTISGDNIHPNEQGYIDLAQYLITGLHNGVCYPESPYKYLNDNANNHLGVVTAINNFINYEMYATEFTHSGTANGEEISYKTLASDSMISGLGNFKIHVPCIFVNSGTFIHGYCIMKFNQRAVTLAPYCLNASSNNYFTYTSIRLTGTNIMIPHDCI